MVTTISVVFFKAYFGEYRSSRLSIIYLSYNRLLSFLQSSSLLLLLLQSLCAVGLTLPGNIRRFRLSTR